MSVSRSKQHVVLLKFTKTVKVEQFLTKKGVSDNVLLSGAGMVIF